MPFEPVFETINYTCGKKTLTEQIKVECRTAVKQEDLLSVLNVSAFATVTKGQADENKFNYGGKVVFYTSYISADGVPAKCECGSEFKGDIKDEIFFPSSKTTVSAVVDKAYAEYSGAYLTVTAYVTIRVKVSDCKEVSALSGGANLIINESELKYPKSYGVKRASYPVEEEFQVGYAVEEVLSHRAQAVVTAVQCGVGCIIVDGEVLLSAIMLQSSQRNGIIKESKTFPFRVEIECEEAMPNMQAAASVKERSFKIDVAVDKENAVSVITASVILDLEGEAFYTDVVTLATDAFSTEQEVEIVKEKVKHTNLGKLSTCAVTVSGRAITPELSVGASVLAVGGERVEIVKVDCAEGGATISGVLSATAYFRDGDEKIFTVNLETPFESLVPCAFSCEDVLDICARAYNGRAKIISLTETELEADITFAVYPEEKTELEIIGEIKPIGEKVKPTAALSVYIATAGEDMWSLAKRLSVSPETLAQTNSDLTFPLTGDERIVIYRQK